MKVRSESFATAAKKSLNSIIKYMPIEQKVFRVPVGVKVVLF